MSMIAVVGGGFSGVIATVHLLRGAPEGSQVVLVNRSGSSARGVAYGTRSERHVLNVPAARMSAFPDDEGHFLRFAQERIPGAEGGSFLPRGVYGEYLDEVLAGAVADAAGRVSYTHRAAGVVSIRRHAAGAELTLDDGTSLAAERVLLAVGNFAPVDPGVPESAFFEASGRYVRDPWAAGALDAVDPSRPVLLIGTGLTMVDVALELKARGQRAPMVALSRRGLLPQAHRSPATPPPPPTFPAELLTLPASARGYLRALRAQARADAERGTDWRETVGAIRHITPRLWERLPEVERKRFLRHLQPYWDVHRHRVAPAPAAGLAELIDSGGLQVRAGRLARIADAAGSVDVAFRTRGATFEVNLQVGAVVNCTGPAARVRSAGDPLMTELVAAGIIRPDPLGIGLDTAGYALRDAAGNPSDTLFYVGPFLRASLWEATAVPELRVHASHAAGAVVESLRPALAARR